MHILYESVGIIGYYISWLVDQWFVCIVVLQVYTDFSELVSCFHDADFFALSYGLMLFCAVLSFNVRLL